MNDQERGSGGHFNSKWTEDRLLEAVAIASRCASVDEAVARINEAFGESSSFDSIDSVFRRRAGTTVFRCVNRDSRDTVPGGVPEVEVSEEVKAPLPPASTLPVPEPEPSIRQLEDEAEERAESARDKRTIKRLLDELRDVRARHDFIDAILSRHEEPRVLRREKASGIREVTAVVLASDWHVEEEVRPASVAGRNEYNLEIAEMRIRRFFHGIVWNVEHHRASGKIVIRDLVLWLGGDLITGYIHPELVECNLLSPTEAILWVMPRLRDGVLYLLDVLGLESIVVPCSYGNHGRLTDKTRITSGYANSIEWLMYCALAEEFKRESRVHFEITESSHQYVEVYDRVLHFHHGDEMRYQGGVGGLGIPLLKRVPQWDLVRRADIHNLGHWHQLLDFGRAVTNGSLIGYNSYAQSIGASFEAPQQAMYYVDSRRGKCMGVTSIWVDDPKREGVVR